MNKNPRRDLLIKELEIRADVMEKYRSDGWKFYDDICKKFGVKCLEELTTSQLIRAVNGDEPENNGESNVKCKCKKKNKSAGDATSNT